MPELPEVETIRSQIEQYLPLKIKKISVSPKLKRNILHTELDIQNKTIIKISRKGKMLDFIFDDGSHLLSHLGMTGAWLIGKKIKKDKHIHLIIEGKDFTLAYDDYRRFGHLYYYSKNQAKEKLATLGVDLLSPDFTLKYLTACLKKYPARMLKVALLDQKYFAGTGNYIANEICARAKILPMRKCNDLKPHEFIKIFKMTKQVIHTALSAGGASFQGGYKNLDGEKGKGSSEFIVFYKKICQSCKITSVKKVYLAQRGTYYCPLCQK